MTFYIILGFSAFLISLLGTRLTILALRKRTMLFEMPKLRGKHKVPVPRGGGIAVVMALIICLLMADISFAIVLAVLMLAAVSLMDDIISVHPLVRLLVQVIAVGLPLSIMHVPVFGGVLPMWMDKLFTAILWIWFTNIFNFMDGIDGLASSEAICIGIGLCLLTAITGTFPNALSAYSLVLACAGVGFWWWNRHPAKIFLGEVGSIPIGFITGYLLILAAQYGYTIPALILPAYFLADGTITPIRRLAQDKKVWVMHTDHYYQKAVHRGRRHDTVVRYIFGINLLLILLATLSALDKDLGVFRLAMGYMSVFMLLGFFAHTGHNPEHEVL